MNILYCGDKNTKDGLLISIMSLMKNVREPLNIYILTADITHGGKHYEPLGAEYAAALDRLVKESDADSSVRCIDVSRQFMAALPEPNMDTRFTPCCMLRLYADELPELPGKLLYLDTDIVCRRSIDEFYNQDISDCEIAGILDYYGRWFFRQRFWRSDYINSGVLLMNLDMMRQTGLLTRCREMCRTKKMFMPDQSALNKLAVKKRILPRRYNDQRKLHDDTVIQHFSTTFRFFPWVYTVTVKPWQIDEVHETLKLHEYDDLLEEYSSLKDEMPSDD